MIVDYKRDMYHNYLVILQEEKEELTYEVSMMQYNRISGLLPMQVKYIDGKAYFYYDISSLQPCSEIYQKDTLSEKELRLLTEGIIKAIEKGKEYLLKEDNFALEPQYLYVNPSSQEVNLCYIPGYSKNIMVQFNQILEFILDHVDYQEEAAVFLAYRLYKKNRDKNSTLFDLKIILHNEEKGYKESSLKKESECDRKKEDDNFIAIEKPKNCMLREKEEEFLYYSLATILKCIACILGGVLLISILCYFGVFTNPMNRKIEYPKIILCLGILGIIELIGLRYLLDEKNKVSKIRTIKIENNKKNNEKEVILPKEEVDLSNLESNVSSEENTILLINEEKNKEEGFCLFSCKKEYQDILLTEFPFFIGKLKTKVDYTINHNSVSRFHAKIEKEGDTVFLTDLNSTNGTFLNGSRLDTNKRTKIEVKDQITFAKVDYIFNKI